MSAGRVYEFAEFRLDAAERQLFRNGKRVPLTPKTVDLLLVLVEGGGNTIEKNSLMQKVWADAVVEDGSLTWHISVLRKALEEGAEGRQFIETIPKRGYRFVPPVSEAPEPGPVVDPEALTSPPTVKPRVSLTAALIAIMAIGAALVWGLRERAPAGRIESLAVLPLQNLSGDPEQEYFTDGMTEALITDLAKIKALRVVSRTSVLRYKGSKKPAPEIARELNVQALVEGAVARVGERVRISARLIRATTDQPVWAESYDRDLRDVLRLQDDVARSIARQVEIEVTPEERARLTGARQMDPDAYQAYLKGRYFWDRRTRDSVHKAIEYFNQAIQKDPAYAAAYSGLADCYSSLGFSFDVGDTAPREAQPKAMAAAARAIALDPTLAEAHTSLAFIKFTYDWDWPGAESEFQRGIALNPRSANGRHWYAHLLIATGRTHEAENESRRALELDPLSPIMNVHLGWHYLQARQYDQALEQLRKTLELDPNYGLAYWYRGLVYEQKRMYADALRELRKAKELLPANTVIDSDLGHVYAMAGKHAEARGILAGLERRAGQSYVSSFELALIHLGLGEKNKAFDRLEQAYRDRSDMLVYLRVDPRLDAVRLDASFEELVRRIAIPP